MDIPEIPVHAAILAQLAVHGDNIALVSIDLDLDLYRI